MKYKRLANKLGVKKFEPGALISKMHDLKGMPKTKAKKHKFGTENGLTKPFAKKHKKVNDHDEDDFKKHKEVSKSLDKKNFDGEKSFKKHKACMKKHKHDKSCE
jgi:hypothetical protein